MSAAVPIPLLMTPRALEISIYYVPRCYVGDVEGEGNDHIERTRTYLRSHGSLMTLHCLRSAGLKIARSASLSTREAPHCISWRSRKTISRKCRFLLYIALTVFKLIVSANAFFGSCRKPHVPNIACFAKLASLNFSNV